MANRNDPTGCRMPPSIKSALFFGIIGGISSVALLTTFLVQIGPHSDNALSQGQDNGCFNFQPDGIGGGIFNTTICAPPVPKKCLEDCINLSTAPKKTST
jgi:hypothetical protein